MELLFVMCLNKIVIFLSVEFIAHELIGRPNKKIKSKIARVSFFWGFSSATKVLDVEFNHRAESYDDRLLWV